MENNTYNKYVNLLRHEMAKALGCTEPIAVALAGAKAKETLGTMPEKMLVKCSKNIIKNVKGVIIPTTTNMRGIDVACVLGAVAGKSKYELEVLRDVKDSDIKTLKEYLARGICKVEELNSKDNLHIICIAESGNDTVEVEIIKSHTNISLVKKNGKVLFENRPSEDDTQYSTINYDFMNFEGVCNFADVFKIDDLKDLFDLEIECNNAIAEEGLKNNYGANVGKTIMKNANGSIKEIAKAYAAAGSDARMNGCSMAVVINSGSGNQGMTILSTVYQYWKHLQLPKEKLYRALCLANLLGLWQKAKIGKLSAFCGAVGAATGAGAAVTYMKNGTREQIGNTIINSLCAAGGIVCDGAKSSCALKIATAVECAINASDMALSGNVFQNGEGLVKGSLEKTVEAVCRMARIGMKGTDEEILNIMLDK